MVQEITEQLEVNLFLACRNEKECGHKCMGVFGESECLPCLNSDCIQAALEAAREAEEISEF